MSQVYVLLFKSEIKSSSCSDGHQARMKGFYNQLPINDADPVSQLAISVLFTSPSSFVFSPPYQLTTQFVHVFGNVKWVSHQSLDPGPEAETGLLY